MTDLEIEATLRRADARMNEALADLTRSLNDLHGRLIHYAETKARRGNTGKSERPDDGEADHG